MNMKTNKILTKIIFNLKMDMYMPLGKLQEVLNTWAKDPDVNNYIFALKVKQNTSNIIDLPYDILKMIAEYNSITTSDDLKFLLWLDPNGKIAKSILKRDTGLDLNPDQVLKILETKVDNNKYQQFFQFKDLIDLNLYYPAIKFFKDHLIDTLRTVSDLHNQYLPYTQSLYNMAIDHHDFDSADIDVGQMYPQRNPKKSILYWLINGDKEQRDFVVENRHSMGFNNFTDEKQFPDRSMVVDLMYQLGYYNEADEAMSYLWPGESPDIKSLELYYLRDKEANQRLFEHFDILLQQGYVEFLDRLNTMKKDYRLVELIRNVLHQYNFSQDDINTFI